MLVTALMPAPGRAVEGFRYSRTVEVERPGWTRVPLDLATLGHMRPGAEDLHLFGPDGRQLALLDTFAPPRERVERLEVLAVDRQEGGWWIRFDTGATPELHRGLEFRFTEHTLASQVRLESSADGSSWRLRAEGDLFQLSDARTTARRSLVYEAVDDRFLRLWWPEAAGFPRATEVLLERPVPRSLEQRVERPTGRKSGSRSTYGIRIDADRPLRLTSELRAAGAVGYRLSRASAGTWQPLTEGTWHLEAGASQIRALRPQALRRGDLRLELWSGGDAPAELTAYTVEYPVRAAVFEAPTAGTYRLAYGSERRVRNRRLVPPGEWARASWVEAGPEETRPAPALPESVAAASTDLPAVGFDAGWRVLAPGAEPGDVARLELPGEVYRASRRNLADLRLEVAGRQLPFVRWQPDLPEEVLAAPALRPEPQDGTGRSRVELDLSELSAGLTRIEVTATSGPFERRLRGWLESPARPGLATGKPRPAFAPWTCRPDPPLPCRHVLTPGRPSGDRLVLELDDRDNPPLSELAVDVWRRRDLLLFVWPPAGEVSLVTGDPELPAPSYDLALAEEDLRARPWIDAKLDLESAAAAAAERDRLGRIVLLVALVLAAVLLLALLARTLRSPM